MSEVSTAVASLFSSHGKAFQELSVEAAEFHSQFVQALNAGAGSYANAEAANVGPCRPWRKVCLPDCQLRMWRFPPAGWICFG